MGALFDFMGGDQDEADGIAAALSDRLSQELVIALVGPVGSGVSTVGKYIKEKLQHDFSYSVAPIIKLSDLIKEDAFHVGKVAPSSQPLGAYINEMQDIGNSLRGKFGLNYLSARAIENIVKYRSESGGYKNGVIVPGRRAYIIDSIKNTDELALLRHMYRESFCLIGIFAPDDIRKQRLISNGVDESAIGKILSRDENEIETFGQKTRKVFIESDLFIRNDELEEVSEYRVKRYLDLLFDTDIHTPTQAESAMYKACAAASNSACMSRQVGAAIVDSRGELISVGWNDVPKAGGGLYNEGDGRVVKDEKHVDKDRRCFKWKRFCRNEIKRERIVDGIASRLLSSNLLKSKKVTSKDIVEAISGSEIDSLIEYSRSIHAEMEAILSVARNGRHSLVGATLYTTVYPCHNCARHIVAAGIADVFYIEPYKKSLAIDLHDDSITENHADESRVRFRQYDGVAPRNFLRLFQPEADRKRKGNLYREPRASALPVFRIPLDGLADSESKVIADLVQRG
ncbi:MAG: anti-phage dCTP deaminase [Rhodospirillaceae bacterium]